MDKYLKEKLEDQEKIMDENSGYDTDFFFGALLSFGTLMGLTTIPNHGGGRSLNLILGGVCLVLAVQMISKGWSRRKKYNAASDEVDKIQHI